MRALASSLLLVAMLGAGAAEPATEVFTLTDGRVLTGTYDADRQRLAVAGGLRVELVVVPEQIAQREPAAAEPVAEAPPDPERIGRRDRNAIAASIRQIETRCADLERYRAGSAAKADAADAALDALDEPERAATAALAACDAGIAEQQRTIDEMKNARALKDERITFIRAHVDGDGRLIEAELGQLDRELTRIDQRLRELDGQLRVRDADRGAVVERMNDLAARRRDLGRRREEQRKRAERAAKELAENQAAKEHCERRLAELDAARAAPAAPRDEAAAAVDPAAPPVSEP